MFRYRHTLAYYQLSGEDGEDTQINQHKTCPRHITDDTPASQDNRVSGASAIRFLDQLTDQENFQIKYDQITSVSQSKELCGTSSRPTLTSWHTPFDCKRRTQFKHIYPLKEMTCCERRHTFNPYERSSLERDQTEESKEYLSANQREMSVLPVRAYEKENDTIGDINASCPRHIREHALRCHISNLTKTCGTCTRPRCRADPPFTGERSGSVPCLIITNLPLHWKNKTPNTRERSLKTSNLAGAYLQANKYPDYINQLDITEGGTQSKNTEATTQTIIHRKPYILYEEITYTRDCDARYVMDIKPDPKIKTRRVICGRTWDPTLGYPGEGTQPSEHTISTGFLSLKEYENALNESKRVEQVFMDLTGLTQPDARRYLQGRRASDAYYDVMYDIRCGRLPNTLIFKDTMLGSHMMQEAEEEMIHSIRTLATITNKQYR